MTMALSPAHLQLLTDTSGIAPAVVAERGYSSCDDLAVLFQYWIVPIAGVSIPGILIPLYCTAGGVAMYRHPTTGDTMPYVIYRPDTPLLGRDGRTRKYLNPPRTSLRLDCPRRAQPVLGDPTQPIWVTEGSRKADALVSHGAYALGLLGVSGWRGTNTTGGKTVLPDWSHVALNGREVRVVFDSDVLTKAAVDRELRAFVRWLQSRTALVHVAYLPTPSTGKCGVDDYLRTHSLTQLEGLLEVPRMTARSRVVSASPHDKRPTIRVATDVVPVTDAIESAITALSGPPRLYQWQGRLATVGDDAHPPAWLENAYGNAVVHPLTLDRLMEEASRAAKFTRFDLRAGQDVPCLPPVWGLRALMARSSWRFPYLRGIATTPVLMPDGRLIDQPGYDAPSGLYLSFPDGVFPPLPGVITRADAKAALEKLQEPFHEFPFVADCHKSTAIAAVLTVIARDLITGCVPAFGVTATVPGSGKGLFIDVISTIATGSVALKWSNITDDTELDKRFVSVAVSGRRLICIDNIARPFGNEIVDAVITAGVVGGRILGSTNDTILPFKSVVFLSGNNLSYVGDMVRRVLPVALDPEVEHPEDLVFEVADLLGWVQQRRPELVMAALAVVKGFLTAPEADTLPHQEPWGSFDSWSQTIRACLRWLGEADPLEGRTSGSKPIPTWTICASSSRRGLRALARRH